MQARPTTTSFGNSRRTDIPKEEIKEKRRSNTNTEGLKMARRMTHLVKKPVEI